MKKDYKKMEDYDIIKNCIKGDKDAFSEIVSRYKNLVYSVVLRMVNNNEEANDLAQEIFIKVYRNLEKYSPEFKVSTWIMRISTNHIIDYRRKKKQETVPIDDMDYELTSSISPEDEYIQQEQKELLENLIEELPQMYREPIVMFHSDGLSYQEIADATNEPLSKIKNRIFRGRKLLKDSILKMKEGGKNGLQRS